ncbi:hypothetical protein NQ318_017361 [Aromia moschata]|uniref:Endonuclease n=1 Tax=Aromia moschata TaxID=1265417 RepID=A0AAV8Z2S8_9CUCU|nr:hypothetical protein NQ318_017361 [Aromia moschata]
MITKRIARYALIGSVAAGGFITGTYFERKQLWSSEYLDKLLNSPLPTFGTVSAATAVSPVPSDTNVSRVSQIMKYGFPSLDNVRSFDDFVLSYDRRNRVAHWVSQNHDYKGSGYDRGHLAAAGNHKSHQNHVEQTFFLSNMAPQVGVGFNRDSWNRLEKHVRRLTKVYTNAHYIYLEKRATEKNYVKYEVIGANHVAVPTHFYKIVVGETPDGKLEMESYVMPNQVIDNQVPLTSFQVPPESIERAAGLLFFSNITPKQTKSS